MNSSNHLLNAEEGIVFDNVLLTNATLVIPTATQSPQSIVDNIVDTELDCVLYDITTVPDNSPYLLRYKIEILPDFFVDLFVFDRRKDQNSIKIVFELMKDRFLNIDQKKAYKRSRAIYEFLDHLVDNRLEELLPHAYFSRTDLSWDCDGIWFEDYAHLLEISPFVDTPHVVSQNIDELLVGPDQLGRNYVFTTSDESSCMRVTVVHEANLSFEDIFKLENPFKHLHCVELDRNTIPLALKENQKANNFYLLPTHCARADVKDSKTNSQAKPMGHILALSDLSISYDFVYPNDIEWPDQLEYTFHSIIRAFLTDPAK